jgi:LAO/AO transport system kinase
MLGMGSGARSGPADDPWAPPVIRTVATEGTGIDELLTGLRDHHEWLARTGVLAIRKRARAEREVMAIALGLLRSRLSDGPGAQRGNELAEQVVAGSLDPFAAAELLIAATAGDSP